MESRPKKEYAVAMKNKTLWVCGLFASSLFVGQSFGAAPLISSVPPEVIQKISEAYSSRVRPIIEAKCADCHTTHGQMPGYYKIPGLKQMIDGDIHSARKRLDLSNGFPFQEKGAMIGDLRAMKAEVSEDEMPLFRYILLHPSAKLTATEKKTILQWVEESLKLLGE